MNNNIKQFYKELEDFLKKSRRNYDSDDGGKVYDVAVISKENRPKDNSTEFIVWLALFVMLDLVFYTYYHKYYLDLKKEFHTPKFEYGLSNTFVNPQAIILRLGRGIHIDKINNAFQKIVPEFYNFITPFLEKHDLNLTDFQKVIFQDKDLRSGIFGILLAQSPGKDLSKLFTMKRDEKLGGARVLHSLED